MDFVELTKTEAIEESFHGMEISECCVESLNGDVVRVEFHLTSKDTPHTIIRIVPAYGHLAVHALAATAPVPE